MVVVEEAGRKSRCLLWEADCPLDLSDMIVFLATAERSTNLYCFFFFPPAKKDAPQVTDNCLSNFNLFANLRGCEYL